MEHHFNVKIASLYGIEESIMVHYFYYWIYKNAANEKHYHDGAYWTYNSKKAFSEIFPYMNETKIGRVIKNLEEKQIIKKSNFNDDKWNRTNWYAFTEKGVQLLTSSSYNTALLQNDTMDDSNLLLCACESINIDSNSKELQLEDTIKENSKKEVDDFVDRMYKLYPTRCPVRNTTLGKSHKDKERIKRLLKTYSQEDIERVIRHEVDEKYGKSYMSNFSTFLNNFPDPSELFSSKSYGYPKDVNDVKDDDVQTKLDFFNYWIEKKAPNVCDGLSNGRPQTEQQYKSLIEHTEGGARALCYVVLVLNRDGWEHYADERGFMWVYSNYIKANGLYKG